MSDLKTFFDKPVYGNTSDLSGDLAAGRGTDPNASPSSDKPAGNIDFWPDDKQPMPEGSSGPSTAESANSVSGLPPLPNRFGPSVEAPEMPTLQDRNPGTIDKR